MGQWATAHATMKSETTSPACGVSGKHNAVRRWQRCAVSTLSAKLFRNALGRGAAAQAITCTDFKLFSIDGADLRKGKDTMDLSQYASSEFIKVDERADGPQQKPIASIEPGKFDKPVVTFSDRTRLSLNGTNVNTIINAFGSTESEDLIGKDVELYVGTIRYQGDDKKSVLLRALSRPAATQSLKAELDDEIRF